MATARKYRGKYPTKIREVWETSTEGVLGCKTNDGSTYFIPQTEMIDAGFTVSPFQVVGLHVANFNWFYTSIGVASLKQQLANTLRKFHHYMKQGARNLHCSTANFYTQDERISYQKEAAIDYRYARILRENYSKMQAELAILQA